MIRTLAPLFVVCFFAMLVSLGVTDDSPDVAVERTREQVRMLDDLYKTVVVLITDKYVHDEEDFPAGSAAVALFAVMKKKGWHEARLIDATGKPRRKKNAPKDDFEREAVKALKAGKSYYERIVTVGGKRSLRAATPVPVVSKKCILCHEQYEDVKKGDPVGAIGYSLTIK